MPENELRLAITNAALLICDGAERTGTPCHACFDQARLVIARFLSCMPPHRPFQAAEMLEQFKKSASDA